MFLPGSLQDSLLPGLAFSHAFPAIKPWSGKQVACLCYYFIKDANSVRLFSCPASAYS